jgi:Flp pilus assembly protein TadD
LPVAQRAIEQSPNDSARHALIGLIYAGLGRKDEAIRAGQHALELLPESKDALDAPILVVALARIYTITGETQKAIELLEHSVKTPAGTNANELRLDPTWDVLRTEPRFQALIK